MIARQPSVPNLICAMIAQSPEPKNPTTQRPQSPLGILRFLVFGCFSRRSLSCPLARDRRDCSAHFLNRSLEPPLLEKRGPAHERVGARSRALHGGAEVDAAIDFDPIMQLSLAPPGVGLLNPGQGFDDEWLYT